MVRTRVNELMVGAFMLVGILALFFLALQVSNLSTVSNEEGYTVTARFDNIGSLKVKAPVSMAGVKVGRVSHIDLDGNSYEAVVTMTIGRQFDTIPDDTFAKIYTAGLLGEQYIGLEAGGSEIYLEDGSEVEMTQSSLVLEEVIGQFLFSKAAEGGSKGTAPEKSNSETSSDEDNAVDIDSAAEETETEAAGNLTAPDKKEAEKTNAKIHNTELQKKTVTKKPIKKAKKTQNSTAEKPKEGEQPSSDTGSWWPQQSSEKKDYFQIP